MKNPAMRGAAVEWKRFNDLFNSGATRQALLKAARAMTDPQNRKTALLHFGIMTPGDRERIRRRWESINAVTDAEAARHCQFEGLPRLGNPAQKRLVAQRRGSKILLRRGGLTLRQFHNRRELTQWARQHRYQIANAR